MKKDIITLYDPIFMHNDAFFGFLIELVVLVKSLDCYHCGSIMSLQNTKRELSKKIFKCKKNLQKKKVSNEFFRKRDS